MLSLGDGGWIDRVAARVRLPLDRRYIARAGALEELRTLARQVRPAHGGPRVLMLEVAERVFSAAENAALRLEPDKERVEVRRLDDVFDDAVRPLADPVTFLKLDTQGSDLEVLYGASGVLHRVAALVTELPVVPIYEGMPSLVDALGHLQDLGFEITGMFPVTRDRDGLGAVEFDCVLRARSTREQG